MALNARQKSLLDKFVAEFADEIKDLIFDDLGETIGSSDIGALDIIGQLSDDSDPTMRDIEDDIWDYILKSLANY